MNAIPFDTLKMARKLEAAGFPGPQAAGAAEAMAEAMSGAELATKADLLAVKAELQTDLQVVKTDVLAVKADLQGVKADVQGLKADVQGLKTDLQTVKTDLQAVRVDLTREMTAMESRLSAAILKVANDLEILRRDVTIRLGAAAFASTGIILAAMRYMLAHP